MGRSRLWCPWLQFRLRSLLSLAELNVWHHRCLCGTAGLAWVPLIHPNLWNVNVIQSQKYTVWTEKKPCSFNLPDIATIIALSLSWKTSVVCHAQRGRMWWWVSVQESTLISWNSEKQWQGVDPWSCPSHGLAREHLDDLVIVCCW